MRRDRLLARYLRFPIIIVSLTLGLSSMSPAAVPPTFGGSRSPFTMILSSSMKSRRACAARPSGESISRWLWRGTSIQTSSKGGDVYLSFAALGVNKFQPASCNMLRMLPAIKATSPSSGYTMKFRFCPENFRSLSISAIQSGTSPLMLRSSLSFNRATSRCRLRLVSLSAASSATSLRWPLVNSSCETRAAASSLARARVASRSLSRRCPSCSPRSIARAERSFAKDASCWAITTRVLANSLTRPSARAPKNSNIPSPMMLATASQNPNVRSLFCQPLLLSSSSALPSSVIRYRMGRIRSARSSIRIPTKRAMVAIKSQTNHASALCSNHVLMISGTNAGEKGITVSPFMANRQRHERTENAVVIGLILAVLIVAADSIYRSFRQ